MAGCIGETIGHTTRCEYLNPQVRGGRTAAQTFRILSPLLVCVFGLSISGCGKDLVLEGAYIEKNGDLAEGLPIRFEQPDLQRLQELRQQEILDPLVSKSLDYGSLTNKAEFESILRIKEWVAAQWPHSLPDPYPPWDAIIILDWIRTGRTGGFCGQYSQVMLQALASFGIPARYVEIGRLTPVDHFVIEVWSNDYDKWVMLDADFNVHFERNGIPLGAVELHDALMNGATDDVDEILGSVREGHVDPNVLPFRGIDNFRYVRVMLKADHLSAPDEDPFDRRNDMVEFGDAVSDRLQATADGSEFWVNHLPFESTSDRVRFNAKLNQVEATITSVAQGQVEMVLKTNYPGFHGYYLSEVDTSSRKEIRSWRTTGPFVIWKPRPGSRLEVRAIGQTMRAGPPAIIGTRFVRR